MAEFVSCGCACHSNSSATDSANVDSEGKYIPRLKIDIHTHILPKNWPDLTKKYGYGEWVSLEHDQPNETYVSYGGSQLNGMAKMMQGGKKFRQVHSTTWSPEHRIIDCDNSGVNVQVLSTVPVMFSYWAKPQDTLDLARYLNDHVAATVAENPERFLGLGTLPMQAPELAIKELRRCINDLGLCGIQIGTSINDWGLDHEELEPFWSACEELDCAVFIHPWGNMANEGRMAQYWFPWLVGMPCETTLAVGALIFGGVLERHPKLKVCLAHGGGSFPATIGRLEHGFHTRPDLCQVRTKVSPINYLGKIWIDSLVHDPDALLYCLKKMGSDRVILGSDYPFVLGEHRPGYLIQLMKELDDETKEKILWKNAVNFLGLDENRFLKNANAAENNNTTEGNNKTNQ